MNLLYRVLRNDQSILRLHAFIKRVLQVSCYFPANMACATLYVISQVLQSKKLANRALTRFAPNIMDCQMIESVQQEDKPKKQESTIVLSNVVVDNSEDKSKDIGKTDEVVEVKNEFQATSYDPFHRNPLHSGANLSFYSELVALVRHFHPSVSLFAHNILQGLLLYL